MAEFTQTDEANESGCHAVVARPDGSFRGYLSIRLARDVASMRGLPGFWRVKGYA